MKKEIAIQVKKFLDLFLTKEMDDDKYTIIMYQPKKPTSMKNDDKKNK